MKDKWKLNEIKHPVLSGGVSYEIVKEYFYAKVFPWSKPESSICSYGTVKTKEEGEQLLDYWVNLDKNTKTIKEI